MIALIGVFTGAVMGVQSEYTLSQFGATAFTGSAVALGSAMQLFANEEVVPSGQMVQLLSPDGEIVAAVEEERFLRDKHAKNRMPLESARYCLRAGGISPRDVDVVAFPYAPIALSSAARWHYARRHWYAPDRALDALFNGNRRYRRNRRRVLELGD